jgi:hypothetical protein
MYEFDAAKPSAEREGARDRDSVLLAATPKACRGLQESDLDAVNEKFEEF